MFAQGQEMVLSYIDKNQQFLACDWLSSLVACAGGASFGGEEYSAPYF